MIFDWFYELVFQWGSMLDEFIKIDSPSLKNVTLSAKE